MVKDRVEASEVPSRWDPRPSLLKIHRRRRRPRRKDWEVWRRRMRKLKDLLVVSLWTSSSFWMVEVGGRMILALC